MDCPICEKGEYKQYKDGCHCSNKNCKVGYTPPITQKGDLRKRSPKSFYRELIGALFLIYTFKPGLYVVGAFFLGIFVVIGWIWITPGGV